MLPDRQRGSVNEWQSCTNMLRKCAPRTTVTGRLHTALMTEQQEHLSVTMSSRVISRPHRMCEYTSHTNASVINIVTLSQSGTARVHVIYN